MTIDQLRALSNSTKEAMNKAAKEMKFLGH